MGSMEAQVAALTEQVKALIERGDERHRQNLSVQGEIRDDVKEIKEQTTMTNGRVTTLEKWRIAVDVVRNFSPEMASPTWKLIGVLLVAAGTLIGGTVAVLGFFGKLR